METPLLAGEFARLRLHFVKRSYIEQEAFGERRHLNIKVKKVDVIRCRLLYCTLVPGMMSNGLLLYEISPFVYFI